ncbi:MAG: nucleotide exchange factor GrpE [Bacteroidales bacterium]
MEEKEKQEAGSRPEGETDATGAFKTKKKKAPTGTHHKEAEELGNKLIELNDRYLRLSAEFDNYRKRTLKEKMELTRSGGEKVLSNLLPVVDNLERALQSVRLSSDVEAIKAGIELIYQNFIEFLKQNGIQEIECQNQEFDSEVHEAITKIPAPEPELKGKVVDVIQKGYYLHDRVIRFARVVVGD